MSKYKAIEDRYKLKLNVFKGVCENLANLSYDSKMKVAAIVISDDFREICSIGYNGNYKGGPNERESDQVGMSGFLHAEENALFHLSVDYEKRSKLIMIVTHKPCRMCIKRIINSGIKRVYYINDYSDNGNNFDSFVNNTSITMSKL